MMALMPERLPDRLPDWPGGCPRPLARHVIQHRIQKALGLAGAGAGGYQRGQVLDGAAPPGLLLVQKGRMLRLEVLEEALAAAAGDEGHAELHIRAP